LHQLEAASDEVASMHRRQFDPWIPPGDGMRAQLQSQLTRMAASRTPRRRYAVAAAAALAIAGASLTYFAILARGSHAVPVSFPEPSLTPGAVSVTSADQVCRMPRPKNRIVPASLRSKDALEDRLHELVCDGSLDLATAQHELAFDVFKDF